MRESGPLGSLPSAGSCNQLPMVARPLAASPKASNQLRGLLRRPGRQQGADDIAPRRRLGEHRQLGLAPELLGDVHDLEPEAQVGLVGAVAGHGVGVRKAREGRRRPLGRKRRDELAKEQLDLR